MSSLRSAPIVRLFDTCAVGIGRVFLATKNENPRVVGSTPERLQREIQLAARLQHPHILTVLDSGETQVPGGPRLWTALGSTRNPTALGILSPSQAILLYPS